MGKITSIWGIGAALEKVVFYNSTSLFSKGTTKTSHLSKDTSPDNTTAIHEDGDNKQTSLNKLCWWNPPENSLPVEFCRKSSIHGLSFIGRPKLHLSERIFWMIAFILGVVAAVLLIADVWHRYYQNPVIVAFQAQEVDIDTVPFPSVTICSMNAFPKSEVKRLQTVASMSGSTEAKAAREALKYVREICHSQRSFSKSFEYAHSRGEEDISLGWNDTIAEDSQREMIDFLLKHTMPCENLIRLCMFAEEEVPCNKIFTPLLTDYGKCCTFNIMPLPLLLNRVKNHTTSTKQSTKSDAEHDSPALKILRWSDDELELWRAWNYDKDGFILSNKSQERPYRQKRAGMPYGLSILVDPNLHDWYCPVSDSEGFRFVLHNSLEMPYVEEFASMIQLNQEIMVEIHPEMTTADDDIRDFKQKDRNCYFPEERQLQFFGPYTAGNCLVECTALMFERECNCTYFYMPRNVHKHVCNTNPQSVDYKCMDNVKLDFVETLKVECGYCDSLCEDIEYHFETTTATLQDPSKLWGDPHPDHMPTPPPWAQNKMSVIHIFLGSETIVPKLRKRLYGTTDLIANTGGLLGLCLGVSVLSAVEIVYFLTLRIFWRVCWKRKAKENKKRKKSPKERIIQLNPKEIPLVRSSIQQAWEVYSGPTQPYYISTDLLKKKKI